MFKVLLIYPYNTSRETNTRWYPAEPLGLLYIASYLSEWAQQHGVPMQIKILDIQLEGPSHCILTARGFRNGMTDEQIKEYVAAFQPDVVGISMNYTFGVQDTLDIAETIKQTIPQTPLVVGGAHATLDHHKVAEHPAVDIVVRGEGEATFQELCGAIYHDSDIDGIAGITYRSNGSVKTNPDRIPISDLDTLPIPDRSFLPYEKYLSKKQYFYTMQSPVGTIFTSRGCPFHCIFCSTQKTWGNNWRGRSAKNILKEVEYLRKNYGVKEIAFQDDQFLGDRQRIIDFCKLAVGKQLGMTFIVPPGNSPAFINGELLDWMMKAGFYRLCFSVDVGTESAVRYVRKPVKLANVRSLVKAANRRGIWTYGTFVIGFPHETAEDIEATIKYAYKLKLDFVRFYIAQPHFGSELYDRYEKEGRLIGLRVGEQHSIMDAFFGTDHLSAAELISLRNEAECNYIKHHWVDFLNPVYLATEFLPKIASFRRFKYFVGLVLRFTEVTLKFKEVEADNATATAKPTE
jgi:radical SAM superfamily enzyme YgiQ (UPF0313 family)